METTDRVYLSPAAVAALELGDAEPSAGNVMAHAIRAAYASGSDPFAGINYGWRDEDRDALTFVVGLVEEASDRGLPVDPDEVHEIADAAVPIYSGELWAVAARLRELVDDDEVRELVAPDADTDRRLAVGLYTVAERILGPFTRSGDQRHESCEWCGTELSERFGFGCCDECSERLAEESKRDLGTR